MPLVTTTYKDQWWEMRAESTNSTSTLIYSKETDNYDQRESLSMVRTGQKRRMEEDVKAFFISFMGHYAKVKGTISLLVTIGHTSTSCITIKFVLMKMPLAVT